jgi:ankyrin repeat protein
VLDKGANVNCRTKYGTTPLSAARAGGHDAIAELLLARMNVGGPSAPTAAVSSTHTIAPFGATAAPNSPTRSSASGGTANMRLDANTDNQQV